MSSPRFRVLTRFPYKIPKEALCNGDRCAVAEGLPLLDIQLVEQSDFEMLVNQIKEEIARFEARASAHVSSA